MNERERAIAIIEARIPLYTDIGQINALKECISSIRGTSCESQTPECPYMREIPSGMDGERYRCDICGATYFLDYEEMK